MMDVKKTIEQAKERIIGSRRRFLKQLSDAIPKDSIAKLDTPFGKQITGLSTLMDKYHNSEWQSQALDLISKSPIYQILEEKEAKGGEAFNYEDELVKTLLKWFKEDFFVWVNKPYCTFCGNKDQSKIKVQSPVAPHLPEHIAGQARLIERYQCQNCSRTYDFPRYNNPAYLLKTRRGRCGEWNNCFILLLTTLGFDVRYVWNAEDHVWCEYFSRNLKRWIHLDSCENAFDNPLLYNDGWAKKMSYSFAIHTHYVVDVSRKYLSPTKVDRHLPRNKMNESHLTHILILLNSKSLNAITDNHEFLEVTSSLVCDQNSQNHSKATNNTPAPRVSGNTTWKVSRGENGE